MSHTVQIRWLASLSASCLWTAQAISQGRRLTDARFASTLREAVCDLQRELTAAGISQHLFWRHVVPLAAGIENNRQLVERTLQRIAGGGSPHTVSRLAGHIADLESAALREFPQLAEELALRGGPLREQWEARGPGMLRKVTEWTHPEALVSNVDLALVRPVCGGGAMAALDHSVVVMEAVLANPWSELPEMVRLGWLIAQLRMNAPMFSESILPERVYRTVALAMLPVALEAAASVEWLSDAEEMISRALVAWELTGENDNTLAPALTAWWQAYVHQRPPWHVAMAALDQSLMARS